MRWNGESKQLPSRLKVSVTIELHSKPDAGSDSRANHSPVIEARVQIGCMDK